MCSSARSILALIEHKRSGIKDTIQGRPSILEPASACLALLSGSGFFRAASPLCRLSTNFFALARRVSFNLSLAIEVSAPSRMLKNTRASAIKNCIRSMTSDVELTTLEDIQDGVRKAPFGRADCCALLNSLSRTSGSDLFSGMSARSCFPNQPWKFSLPLLAPDSAARVRHESSEMLCDVALTIRSLSSIYQR
jgi:hypothetical protein